MIRLDDWLSATQGTLCGPAYSTCFGDLAFDSRIVLPGQLFLALVTETGDGHDYIADAVQAGATGIVCQLPPADLPVGVTCVRVENTQQALLAYARYILQQRHVRVIGITGSVGKTSTKEAVASVLGQIGPVFKNRGSYNGRLGLPIALGRLEDESLAVLEMACDGLDEIRVLAEVTQPAIGVVTQVSESHLQYLGSLEAIAAEKGRLVEALPADGVAILNYDDARVRAMAERTHARVITFGLLAGADLVGTAVSTSGEGIRLQATWRGKSVFLESSLVGRHHAYTLLAAAAVGLAEGLSWEQIRAGLATVQPLPGRARLLAGMQGSQILDDSYNASPSSALAALQTLQDLPCERRIVVLGDMAQLGEQAQEGHRRVGARCARIADLLITKGELARIAAEAAVAAGLPASQVRITFSYEDVVRALQETLRAGDLVLVKGSAEARLEHVTRQIMAQPEQAPELLPRQHRGWQQARLQRPERPTWVEIDLEAIAHNVRRLAEIVGPGVELLAVLKADGYGHGAVKVAHTALNNGASWVGVACLGEALTLRQAGVTAPILVLGYTPPWQARQAVLQRVVVTVFSLEVATALNRAAADLGQPACCHVKVDTGMGRLGLLPEHVLPFMRALQQLPHLQVDGIFTHMAAADDFDLDYTCQQLASFDRVLAELGAEGLLPRHIHAANSAALLRAPAGRYNMVRPGIALFGLDPSEEAPCPPDFRPALAFKCQIAQVKELPPGSPVSYGRTFYTQRPSRIAVIPVGYADGFRRGPHHWGEVLVRGRRAPIVGRVCMDQTMIDVTDIPGVSQGDEVVLIGAQGDEAITVDEVARRLGTINYEVVSEILARVPRVV